MSDLRPAATRPLPTILVGVLVAGAIVYHGAARRYDVQHVGGPFLVRTDHLTGRTQGCKLTRTATGEPDVTCTP